MMLLLVRYPDGSLTPAILICAAGNRLRVSVPHCDDAIEFRWAGGQWLSESGEVVEIEFDVSLYEVYGSVQQGHDLPGPPTTNGDGFARLPIIFRVPAN